MILPGYAFVSSDGRAHSRQLGVHDDAMVPGMTELARSVHQAGGKIALQLVHCGAHSDTNVTGEQPMGPSVLSANGAQICRAMTQDDIDAVVQAFEDAALRVKAAGFDAVQLHAAHGYLLSQFISPFYNRRTDAYGGSVENRSRILLDVCRRVRRAVGRDYPVLIKLNCTDFLDDGLRLEDVVQIARWLQEGGVDAIELSGGTIRGYRMLGDVDRIAFRTVREEAYYRDSARRLKREISVPIILTGGIRSYEVAEKLVQSGAADYVDLCRPLIREPELVKRWELGDTRRSACVSDNACFGPIAQGKGPLCVHATKA